MERLLDGLAGKYQPAFVNEKVGSICRLLNLRRHIKPIIIEHSEWWKHTWILLGTLFPDCLEFIFTVSFSADKTKILFSHSKKTKQAESTRWWALPVSLIFYFERNANPLLRNGFGLLRQRRFYLACRPIETSLPSSRNDCHISYRKGQSYFYPIRESALVIQLYSKGESCDPTYFHFTIQIKSKWKYAGFMRIPRPSKASPVANGLLASPSTTGCPAEFCGTNKHYQNVAVPE